MLYFYILMMLQIVVESFPVSSSGHMHIFVLYMKYYDVFLPDFIYASWFMHLLHIPTIGIVVGWFFEQWKPIVLHPIRYKKSIISLFCIGFIADAVTTCFFIMWQIIGISWWMLGIGFVITGCALYSLQWCVKKYYAMPWYGTAILLGIAQGFALLPGVSRLALTYVVGRWCGLSCHKSFALSWLIMMPLLVAGSLHGCVGLYLYGIPSELLHPLLGISILGASIIAWYGLCLIYHMACAHTLYRWWVYMIAPIFVWAYVVMGRYCI